MLLSVDFMEEVALDTSFGATSISLLTEKAYFAHGSNTSKGRDRYYIAVHLNYVKT